MQQVLTITKPLLDVAEVGLQRCRYETGNRTETHQSDATSDRPTCQTSEACQLAASRKTTATTSHEPTAETDAHSGCPAVRRWGGRTRGHRTVTAGVFRRSGNWKNTRHDRHCNSQNILVKEGTGGSCNVSSVHRDTGKQIHRSPTARRCQGEARQRRRIRTTRGQRRQLRHRCRFYLNANSQPTAIVIRLANKTFDAKLAFYAITWRRHSTSFRRNVYLDIAKDVFDDRSAIKLDKKY